MRILRPALSQTHRRIPRSCRSFNSFRVLTLHHVGIDSDIDRATTRLSLPLRSFSTSSGSSNDQGDDEITKTTPTMNTAATNNVRSIIVEPDFFGEPVSFLEPPHPEALEKFDAYCMAVVSKGKVAFHGSEEMGIAVKAANAMAGAWSDLLYHTRHSPMIMAAAVAPVLAQAGLGYVRTMDRTVLSPFKVSLEHIAKTAVSYRDHPELPGRERMHLCALEHLLKEERSEALGVYVELLERCPGDALGLSLAMDLAYVQGDSRAARKVAGTVSSYWAERKNVMFGHSLGTALIGLGLAVGGQTMQSEFLVEAKLSLDLQGVGGVAAFALANIYDQEGRVSEGISWLAGYDGVRMYEDCGFLFFNSKLGGYGSRFSLDREGDRVVKALRLYDTNFDPVLEYSGYGAGKPLDKPQMRSPKKRAEMVTEQAQSILAAVFGRSKSKETDASSTSTEAQSTESKETKSNNTDGVSIVDALTFLPPTPQFLADATLTLLRLTLNGSVDPDSKRWRQLKTAWGVLLDRLGDTKLPDGIAMTACIMFDPADVPCDADIDGDEDLLEVKTGLWSMGSLLGIGTDSIPDEKEGESAEWKIIVNQLSKASDPRSKSYRLQRGLLWAIDAKPLFEHSVCFAALMAEDYESLCKARSVCSNGVTVRQNSPDEWWRYSLILDKLGDESAARDARQASLGFGAGEGGYFGDDSPRS